MTHRITVELTEEQWADLNRARLERMDREKRYIDSGDMLQELVQEVVRSFTQKPARPQSAARAEAPAATKRSNGGSAPRKGKAPEKPAPVAVEEPEEPPVSDEPVISDEAVVKGLPESHRYLRPIPGEPAQRGRTSLEERVRRYRYWLEHPQQD